MKQSKVKLFSFHTLVFLASIAAITALIISYFSPYIDPINNRIIPLFGLAYPVIMLGNMLLFLYWLVLRKWKMTILYLFVFIAGISVHHRFITWNSPSKNDSDKTLSIVSYNVRLFDVYDWFGRGTQTKEAIYRYIDSVGADIYCFQEFYNENDSKEFNSIKNIKNILGKAHHYGRYTSGSRGKSRFGVVTISRYPIIHSGYLDLNSVASNHCIYTDIQKEEEIFRIYNLHIGSIQVQDDEYDLFSSLPNNLETDKTERSKRLIGRLVGAFKTRSKQVDDIITHASSSPYPVIICGDFNDTPISNAYHKFYSKYSDAFLSAGKGIGTTYAGRIPANRIDFIFHDKTFNATKFAIQREVLSDHRAIYTELAILTERD